MLPSVWVSRFNRRYQKGRCEMAYLAEVAHWIQREIWPNTFRGQVTLVAIAVAEMLVLWGSIALERLPIKAGD